MMRNLFGGTSTDGAGVQSGGPKGPSPAALTIESVPDSEAEKFLEQHAQRLMQAFIDIMDARANELRQAVEDSYSDVDESRTMFSGTILDVPAQSSNFERITDILAYCGPGQGLLTLGNFQIPIPAATFVSIGCKMRLGNTDRRRLSSVTVAGGTPGLDGTGPAGFLALALWGKEIPVGAMAW